VNNSNEKVIYNTENYSATLREIQFMEPNEVTAQIVDAAYRIHMSLGPGLLETVYEVALAQELRKRGLPVRRQAPVPIEYDGLKFDEGFRMDLLVDESIIVEIKSVEKNHPVHPKQLRTHLVLAKLQLGLVLNFGLERMKDGITRIVNGYPEVSAQVAENKSGVSRRDAEGAEEAKRVGDAGDFSNIFG
jgi:GxxExxY protein